MTDALVREIDNTIGHPLVVDLDGTLIKSDLLIESFFANIGSNPARILKLPSVLMRGKAYLKAWIAKETLIDVTALPYDARVIALVREAREAGRKVYLASASNERYVKAVSEHLGLFDGWFASTESENLSSSTKARRLVEQFGERGFDYVGNDKADQAVWAHASRRIAVDPSKSVRDELRKSDADAVVLARESGGLRPWIKLVRVHQWAKNALIFLPLLTAQRFDAHSIVLAVGAFFAFSFAASSVYILNDLVDIEADRKHPSKRRRPLAAGTVPILSAMVVGLGLLIAALVISAFVGIAFVGVLLAYLALTTAYTFFLKRKMMIDVVALASLYTIRVIGGAAAVLVPMSEWLLAFSLFIFSSLALIKRYVELAARVDADLPDPSNRNYRKLDLDIIAALAAASGFNAITVFALYISSDTVRQLYRHPVWLWFICPLLLYWIGRAIIMAHRRLMDDDPILFALKDWNSLLAFGLVVVLLALAF